MRYFQCLQTEQSMGYEENAQVNSIAFSAERGVLAAGTAAGQMAFWQYRGAVTDGATASEPEEQWQLQSPAVLSGNVAHVSWGTEQQLLCCAMSGGSTVYQLRQQVLSSHYRDGVALVQNGPCSLQAGLFNSSIHAEVATDIQIHGLNTTKVNFTSIHVIYCLSY